MRTCLRNCFAFLFLSVLICTGFELNQANAQTAAIQGIITDRATGQPLEGANIALQELPSASGQLLGMATDQNGFYQISGLTSGRYALRISYIGYISHEDTLSLAGKERRTISLTLVPDEEQLDEVIVAPAESGASGIAAGRQRVEAVDLSRVPTPAGTGDLASYLQAMPGVVTTGDRGGQLYIRGGSPAENMVLVDGVLIFQPFHILGFFSAFPENLVSEADFYAGGFGARYNGRTSSVLDVKMRNGNRYETSGSASVSPFVAEVMAEGPIKNGRTSWIASVRRSLVEESSPFVLDRQYPLRFESQYFKLTHFGVSDSRCSITAMRTYDRGRLDVDRDDVVRWSNFVLGGQCVVLPEGSDLLFDISGGFSYVSNATGQGNDPELTSSALRANLDLNMTRYFGQLRFDYGGFVHIRSLKYDMSEQFGGPQIDDEHLLSTGAYAEATIPLGNVTLTPGAAFALHKDTFAPSLDPRLRATWQPGGREDEQLSLAAGLYRQPLVGITGTRDAASVFTAWMSSPVNGSQMKAVHLLLGWRQSLATGLQWSVEGYRKWMRHLPIPAWSNLVQFTTELASAEGEVYGGDFRLEYNRGAIYGLIGYGYSLTEYQTSQEHFTAWFGEPSRTYHPPHDRRHQLNTIFSLELGDYTAGVRWELGSGLPFTRPMGFDELFNFKEELPQVKQEYGTQRVILQELYQGRMPAYHRLDLSIERTFELTSVNLDLQVGAINFYDQANIFYYDVYTHRRVDQLPLAPYLSVKLETR